MLQFFGVTSGLVVPIGGRTEMQFDQSTRRRFIKLLGSAAVTASPLVARAQQAAMPTVGFLGASTPAAAEQWVAAFAQRLRELGWTEGRNVAIEYRWAEGRNERMAEIAAEFVRLKVDVIVIARGGGSILLGRLYNDSGSPANCRSCRGFR